MTNSFKINRGLDASNLLLELQGRKNCSRLMACYFLGRELCAKVCAYRHGCDVCRHKGKTKKVCSFLICRQNICESAAGSK